MTAKETFGDKLLAGTCGFVTTVGFGAGGVFVETFSSSPAIYLAP
jgi:hypothetical protein